MKWPDWAVLGADAESHPSRGAWIEMGRRAKCLPPLICRTPRGVRGLK